MSGQREREIAVGLMAKAGRDVGKNRGPQHGSVEPSFRMIAELWSVHINHAVRHRTNIDAVPIHLTAWDVLQMMSLLKKARAVYGDDTLADHYSDDIGYTGLAGGIARAIGGDEQLTAVGMAVGADETPIPEFLTRKKANAE